LRKTRSDYRFLFAGGGTGGHLFPSLAVAEKIRTMIPDAEIMFVGSRSKIEGRVVPKAGFAFSPIWIKGFSRKFTLDNLLFPLKLIVSLIQSLIINMRFKPKVAIGSGGYVSGPAIWGSSVMGAKIILLEQNSYPGVTTRLLERYATEIHLGFEDSAKYFKNKNILNFTGNPVRESLLRINREKAHILLMLNPSLKTIFISGGSLGAGSINKATEKFLNDYNPKDLNIIWQTGKNYFASYKHFNAGNVIVKDFIDDMNLAYSACDLLVSRAGATTIAEILVLGIASILIPSPNVAENHQYFNAKSLSDRKAAILIEDSDLSGVFGTEVIKILNDEKKLNEIRTNAASLGRINAAKIIAEHAIKYCKQ